MATTDRPKARQSQLVTTYGVGSLYPAGDQSFMVCGTDEWDEKWSPSVEEPRLARSLGVHSFKAPSSGKRSGDVPVVRFPQFHYCPECRRLDRFWAFDARKMECPDCTRDLTPSRFVACCENGHIEDFPYFQWVHRGADTTGSDHTMRLEARGASSSLADIVVRCSCGVPAHDLDGSFNRNALTEIKRCGGKRPWLPGAPDEICDKPLRALQRGSSNVWFSAVRSSISIPPWSSPNAQFVTKHWTVLEHLPEDGTGGCPTGNDCRAKRPVSRRNHRGRARTEGARIAHAADGQGTARRGVPRSDRRKRRRRDGHVPVCSSRCRCPASRNRSPGLEGHETARGTGAPRVLQSDADADRHHQSAPRSPQRDSPLLAPSDRGAR